MRYLELCLLPPFSESIFRIPLLSKKAILIFIFVYLFPQNLKTEKREYFATSGCNLSLKGEQPPWQDSQGGDFLY
jgi:hypothetical protein